MVGEGIRSLLRRTVMVNEVAGYSCDYVKYYEKDYPGPLNEEGERHRLEDDLGDGRWMRLKYVVPLKYKGRNAAHVRQFIKALPKMAEYLEKHPDVEGIFGSSDIIKNNPGLLERIGFTISDVDPRLAFITRDEVIELYGSEAEDDDE